jgi:hypothetical protein
MIFERFIATITRNSVIRAVFSLGGVRLRGRFTVLLADGTDDVWCRLQEKREQPALEHREGDCADLTVVRERIDNEPDERNEKGEVYGHGSLS